MTSPPGLSLSIQNAVSNNAAHSLNMIPGLAFGSPPSSRSPGRITGHTFSPAPPIFQRAQSSHATPSKPAVLGRISSESNVAVPPVAPAIPNDELSEGEFEEEFEDLYESRDGGVNTGSTTRKLQTAPQHSHEAVGSADDSSIYDHNTPRLDINDDTSSPASHKDEPSKPLPAASHDPVSIPNSSTTQCQSMGGEVVAPGSTAPHDKQQTIADAKKKAQEAILALWPLKVRYQNYVEEGFDATVMQTLFKELGLDMNNAKINQGTIRPSASAPQPTKDAAGASLNAERASKAESAAPPDPTRSTEVASSDPNPENGSKPPVRSAAEERKDKIARKLAAKSQKPPVVPAVAPQSAPTESVSTTTVKPKTRAETNALLHQKLAALKRSQEKAAADRLALAAQSASHVMTENASPVTVVPQIDDRQSTVVVPVRGEPVEHTSKPPVVLAEPSVIMSAISAASLSNSRETSRAPKRPVATDFDDAIDYPPVNLKRTRTQDTLIIDVSDDEDVEMEIGSPVEDTTVSAFGRDQTSEIQGHLSTTIPGTPTEQIVGRASTAPVPEGNGKLHLLRGKIEEMRRKIAEAEAKKTGRTPVNMGSPRSQSPLPQDVESRKLPKLAELRQSVEQGSPSRSGRIVSVELLLVESDLKAKQDKLKAVVAEAARLELEIQSTLAQRTRLASEMEHLPSENENIEPTDREGPLQTAANDTQSAAQQRTTKTSANLADVLYADHARQPIETLATSGTSAVNEADEPAAREDETTTSVRVSSEASNSPSSMDISEGGDDSAEDSDVSMQADDDMDDDDDEHRPVDNVSQSASSASMASEDATSHRNEPHAPDHSSVEERNPQSLTETSGNDRLAICETSPMDHTATLDDAPRTIHKDEDTSFEIAQEPPHLGEAQAQDNVNTKTTNSSNGRACGSLTLPQIDAQASPVQEDVSSYHSPLEYFRAYRFHPRFFNEVSGGLKSLTYSSKIDIEQMLCPSESVGEECASPTCEYQHFNKMVLSGASS